jgi:hypothetical protein
MCITFLFMPPSPPLPLPGVVLPGVVKQNYKKPKHVPFTHIMVMINVDGVNEID